MGSCPAPPGTSPLVGQITVGGEGLPGESRGCKPTEGWKVAGRKEGWGSRIRCSGNSNSPPKRCKPSLAGAGGGGWGAKD